MKIGPFTFPPIEDKEDLRAKASLIYQGHASTFYPRHHPIWTPRNMTALAQQGFMKNAIVYRCVRMISEAAACVPWLLYQGKAELDEHPLLTLLRKPNQTQSGVDLMEVLYAYLQLSGNAYLEMVEANEDLRELYVLRSDRMRVVTDERGWVSGYEYQVGGRKTLFNRKNNRLAILHMKLFHPINDYYGLSPMDAAAYGIDIHNAAGSWSKALLDNSARPSGALIYKGVDGAPNLTQEQFQRLKSELEDNYQGAGNAGRPLLLEGGLDWMSMGHSPRDMDFINTKHVAAREIALAFGVPPMLLGIPGDNSFSNYSEANKTFWRQTILPLITRAAQTLTQWLGNYFGQDLRLSFDTDRIDALAYERESLWKRVSQSEFLTINEKRAAIGYQPIEGGDVLQSHQKPSLTDEADGTQPTSQSRNPSRI